MNRRRQQGLGVALGGYSLGIPAVAYLVVQDAESVHFGYMRLATWKNRIPVVRTLLTLLRQLQCLCTFLREVSGPGVLHANKEGIRCRSVQM